MDNYHKFNKLISKLILSKTYYWNAGIIWMIVNLGIREWRIQGIESILILKLFQNERVYYFLFYRGFYLLSTMAFHTSPLWLIGIPALISLFMSRVTVNCTGFFRFTTTVFQRDSTWVINIQYSDNFQYVIILYSSHLYSDHFNQDNPIGLSTGSSLLWVAILLHKSYFRIQTFRNFSKFIKNIKYFSLKIDKNFLFMIFNVLHSWSSWPPLGRAQTPPSCPVPLSSVAPLSPPNFPPRQFWSQICRIWGLVGTQDWASHTTLRCPSASARPSAACWRRPSPVGRCKIVKPSQKVDIPICFRHDGITTGDTVASRYPGQCNNDLTCGLWSSFNSRRYLDWIW